MKMKFLSRKELLAVIVISVFLLSVFSLGFTTLGAKPNNNSSNKTDYAIVEFDGRTRTNTQHANYKAWLHSNAPWAIIAREYNTVLDGMAIKLNGRSMNSLKGPGVKSVTASSLYQPLMSESVPLISADQVWSALGRDPEESGAFGDIKVGVIDSGIDDSHDFISACRDSVSHKVFFSGTNNLGAPDRVFDHGTHVAGTIGGCYTTGDVTVGGKLLPLANAMSGVAPGVELHDYNVFPGYGAGFIAFGGSAFSHDIIAAVEEAVLDGMDVINLSLGGSVQGPHDILAEAINRAVDAGTIAVISAGNEGNNLLTVGSPGNAANAITVAAASNAHTAVGTTIVFGGYSLAAAEGDFDTFSPSVSAKTSLTTPADGCGSINEDLTDLIAVIDRGTCSFTLKVLNAEAQGAVGVIIANNQPGAAIPMAHDDAYAFPQIPAVMVSESDGFVLKTHIPGVVTVDSSGLVEIPAASDLIAGFSSIGPTPYDFRQKPDITAPGVNILSSVFDGEFAFFQGTSMAAPHVTGAVAVLLAGNPNLTPEQVKSAIVNNADRNDNLDYGTFSGLVYGPLAMGGGRLNVMSAYNAEVYAAPASLSFGGHTGGSPFVSSTEFTLENSGNSAISCSVSVTTDRWPYNDFVIDPKVPGDVYFADWAFSGGAAQYISLSTSSVTLAAGGSDTVSVTFDAGRSLYGTGWSFGDITADCGTDTLKLPWSLIFQQNSGALNGHAPSGFLMDPEGNAIFADFGAAMPSID